MCSTVAGINCVDLGRDGPEGEVLGHQRCTPCRRSLYDGRWHMYDNSLSALYTLCDGKTIAGVEDIGADGGLRGQRRQDRAGPHRQVPLPQRHQPQRLPDRLRHACARLAEEYQVLQPARA